LTSTGSLINGIIPRSVKAIVRRKLGIPNGYAFRVADSIEEQTICFVYHDRRFTVRADRTTPLYETIAEVIDYDCYQVSDLQWPRQPGYIVDIGANIGMTALLFSQLPCYRIICYEPLATNCVRLRSNLVLNAISNVDVIPSAVSDIHGSIWFDVAPESVGGRVAASGHKCAAGHVLTHVDCVPLNEVLAVCGTYEITLMKLDCEGGEYAIVDQLTPKLAENIRYMTFEIHDLDARRNLRSISAKLIRLGYTLQFKPDMFSRGTLHHILAAHS
jgi:FkbM family methyltransferase